MKLQEFNLNLVPGGIEPHVQAAQFEKGRPYAASMYDGREPYVFDGTESVTICGTKADGHGFSVDKTDADAAITAASGGSVLTFKNTEAMTDAAGPAIVSVILSKGAVEIGTINFVMDVQVRGLQPETVIHSDSFGGIITDAVQEYLEEHWDEIVSSGLTDEAKEALLACFANVAWIGDDGQDYYDALHDALYPPIPATSITLNSASLSFVTLNSTQQLTATVLPADTTDTVTWSSSDTSVATVSSSGLVTALAYGNATITATAGSISATCSVVVAQATLSSISAVYTQSGTVYNTDSLDSLKTDLVVTATYSDGSTAVVTDYTLSGTLSVGTSTITVTYGGKTTTFTVTVTEYEIPYLYNWDFTQSLTDSVENVTVTSASGRAPTQGSTGLVFSAATQEICVPVSIDMSGKTLEIDVASMDFAGNTSNHSRFILLTNSETSTTGAGPMIFRSTGVWQSYGWGGASGGSADWKGQWSADSANTGNNTINAISGKTVKISFDSDGHTMTLYFGDALVGTVTNMNFSNTNMRYLFIGGLVSGYASAGNQFYNATITGMRIYANETEAA